VEIKDGGKDRKGKIAMRKNNGLFFGMLAMALVLGLTLTGCGTLDLNSAIFGAEDTSVNWQMAEASVTPPVNSLTKLKNTSGDASAIYRYADRAHAADNTWYVLTSEEKPGETFYAYKNVARDGNSSAWEIYRE
jgi:hypothetical protein